MHRGPLLAYLMADPELSLQSVLIIAAIIGRTKALTYVGLVALFSAVAGFSYGAWIDGAPLAVLLLSLAAFVGLLAALLAFASRRSAALHGA
jgi:phosphatidylglycerophosphate synthase